MLGMNGLSAFSKWGLCFGLILDKAPSIFLSKMQKWSRFSLLWCEAAEAFGGSHDSESEALQRLVDAQHNWTKPQLAFLDHTKLCLTGSASLRHGHARDGEVACSRECYTRATMLEPLVRDLIDRRVPGDLLAAGVYRGGLAVYMAALVHTVIEWILGWRVCCAHDAEWAIDGFTLTLSTIATNKTLGSVPPPSPDP